jgi:ubiquinone/menaquinone biosynthesis C-methylase UbiE
MTYRAKDHYRDEEVAGSYDAKRFTGRKGKLVDRREQRLILDTIRRAGVHPPGSVVDVPCGTGRLTLSLAAAGFLVTGVDVSEQMLDRAVARWAGLPPASRPAVVVGDAESLPFVDDVFDVVVSLRLLGHLPPPTRVRVLCEFRRVSRGPVVVAFYHRLSVQGLVRRRSRRGLPWYPVGLAQIDQELAASGLRRVGRRFMLPFISETVVVQAEPV